MYFKPGTERFDRLATAAGDFERPFDCSWRLPQAAVLGSYRREEIIRWELGWNMCVPAEGMLQQFVKLYDQPSETILKYAKRWGVLGICEDHALPIGHGCSPRGGPKISLKYSEKYSGDQYMGADGDPISAWRQFSEAANAILAIYALLEAGESPADQLWRNALRPGPHPAFRNVLGDVTWDAAPWWNREFDREILIDFCVNRWMRIGGVSPQCDPKTSAIHFASEGLFGAIAVQLLLTISGSEGWVVCSNPKCSEVYPSLTRRPKRGQRHFCPKCRAKRIPKLFADRDYARRRRLT